MEKVEEKKMVKNPFPAMLERLLPDHNQEFRMAMLWECTAYPAAGMDEEGLALYEKQIKEALAARPEDPIGWSHEQMDKQMTAAHELEKKTVALLAEQSYRHGASYASTLTCDGCKQDSVSGTGKTQSLADRDAAEDAERSGWTIKDGKPLCHDCWRKPRAKAEGEKI